MQDFIPNEKRSRPTVSFSMSSGDRDWLKTTADNLGINRSDLLQRIIATFRRSEMSMSELRESEDSHVTSSTP